MRLAPAFVVVVVVGVGVVVAVGLGCEPPPSLVQPIATGTTPNDLVLSACADGPVALVTASGDARLDVLALDGSRSPRAVFLNDGSQPWMLDVVPGNSSPNAVVSLFGSNEVALVSPCDEQVFRRARADVLVEVDPPVTLTTATDVDDDGATELVVARMLPRNPQAVAVVGADVFVTFTNILAFATGDDPMLSGPGLLARFHVDGDELAFVDALTLPCENPGGLGSDGQRLVVGCAGRFVVRAGVHQRQSSGGLVVVDAAAFSITAFQALDDFSAGTPAFLGSDIVVGNLLGGELRRFTADLEPVDSVVLGGADESIFSVVAAGNDIAAALFVASVLVVSPFDAATEVQMGNEGPTRGLLDVAVDDDQAFGLLTLSAELVRVALP